ncbi:hypothetical protein J3Q64DRAFT_1753761 [Phycomyces blakesleeanus]|uniref:Uncharacterized protein n=1 Tax=Phycomyces blakesleeanus TaxID=4837 RepID=A0ABR3AU36_PHYBL
MLNNIYIYSIFFSLPIKIWYYIDPLDLIVTMDTMVTMATNYRFTILWLNIKVGFNKIKFIFTAKSFDFLFSEGLN